MLARLAVTAFVLVFCFGIAKADPVVPAGTVTGGTIQATSTIFQSIVFNINTLDPNGNPVVVAGFSQGGTIFFATAPGSGIPITFQAGIAGSADVGNSNLQVLFSGTGPTIPQTNAPTLDLIGQGQLTFSGTVYASHSDMFIGINPLFTISGVFNGPVLLHLELGPDGLYQLKTVTADLTANVPEPISAVLFGTGMLFTAVAAKRRRKRN